VARQTGTTQDNAFGRRYLIEMLTYIEENFEPDDVFSDEVLLAWSRSQVSRRYDPDEIFPAYELAQWATDNGYVKVE
jgi:hypothetical protein